MYINTVVLLCFVISIVKEKPKKFNETLYNKIKFTSIFFKKNY